MAKKKTIIVVKGTIKNGILRIPVMDLFIKDIIKKKNKEINHLKGKINKQVDKSCIICSSKPKYSEKYDAYYCPKCLYWLERICFDRNCEFCKDRPKYPKK